MRVSFVHDQKIIVGENGTVFSVGQFPYRIWERYLRAFDEVQVIARREVDNTILHRSGLVQSSIPRVRFVFAPNVARVCTYNSAYSKKGQCNLPPIATNTKCRHAIMRNHHTHSPFTVLIVPSSTDSNRGDQAIVWMPREMLKEIQHECRTVLLDFDLRLSDSNNAKSKKVGFEIMPAVLLHPGRFGKSRPSKLDRVSV